MRISSLPIPGITSAQIQAIIGDDHAGKIKLIYNGLNIRQFQPERERNAGGDELRLLCVARLIEQKGLTYLLRACRQLLDSGLKLRVDIVGGFEDVFMNYYIELKRLHQLLGLENTVHFAGYLPFEEALVLLSKGRRIRSALRYCTKRKPRHHPQRRSRGHGHATTGRCNEP